MIKLFKDYCAQCSNKFKYYMCDPVACEAIWNHQQERIKQYENCLTCEYGAGIECSYAGEGTCTDFDKWEAETSK